MKTRKAIFFDRDGTLIVDKHYLSKVEDIEYFSDTMTALKILEDLNYDFFVVTNQSGVARGYFTLDRVELIHQRLQEDMKRNNISPFKDFAICPHFPQENCPCRKPSGKLILELINKYQISSSQSYMVGDKLIDAQAGKNAGIHGIIVRSNKEEDFSYFENLLDFALYLKSKP